MLKLLIDECVPYRVVVKLREEGFDVLSVAESMKSAKDETILEAALVQKRVLVTNDKDFGEIIYRNKLKRRGVILLRLADGSCKNTLKNLLSLFKRFGKTIKRKDLIVVTGKSIRIRSF